MRGRAANTILEVQFQELHPFRHEFSAFTVPNRKDHRALWLFLPTSPGAFQFGGELRRLKKICCAAGGPRPAMKSPGYKTTPGEPGFGVPAAAKAPFTGRRS